MLQISNPHAEVDRKPILKALSVNAGEVHAMVRPNGAGPTLGGAERRR